MYSEVLSNRRDKWIMEVEVRINMASDLFSADALYHVDCDKKVSKFQGISNRY